MKNLNANFPDLKIELMTGGESDGLILLEQSNGGNIDRVAIHPIHVRYLAEKMGLIETSDPTARKTIAALTRRLLALEGRIVHMAYWLTNHSDSKHADLSYEQTYAMATADIAEEFCADLVDTEPPAMTPDPTPTNKGSLASAPYGHGASTVQAPLI
jgi:hypothetical protein